MYQNILKASLWERFGDRPDAEELIRRIRESLDGLKGLPPDIREGALASYMEAFEGVWYTVLTLWYVCSHLPFPHGDLFHH